MTREDILQALRFVAMGRVNHPQVETFVNALWEKLTEPKEVVYRPLIDVPVAGEVADPTPKKRKKAD